MTEGCAHCAEVDAHLDALQAFVDRCHELGATDTDIVKHALEDQARIREELAPLSIENADLRATVVCLEAERDTAVTQVATYAAQALDLIERLEKAEGERDTFDRAFHNTLVRAEKLETREAVWRAALEQILRDMTDTPAIQLLDGKFYCTVPEQRRDEVAALLTAGPGTK